MTNPNNSSGKNKNNGPLAAARILLAATLAVGTPAALAGCNTNNAGATSGGNTTGIEQPSNPGGNTTIEDPQVSGQTTNPDQSQNQGGNQQQQQPATPEISNGTFDINHFAGRVYEGSPDDIYSNFFLELSTYCHENPPAGEWKLIAGPPNGKEFCLIRVVDDNNGQPKKIVEYCIYFVDNGHGVNTVYIN